MSKIPVFFTAPVIFTKDKTWIKKAHRVKEGSIVLLPEDAILYIPDPMNELQLQPPVVMKGQSEGENTMKALKLFEHYLWVVYGEKPVEPMWSQLKKELK